VARTAGYVGRRRRPCGRRGVAPSSLAAPPSRWEARGEAQQAGRSENELKVFNKNGTQWMSGAWVEVGEVTGSDGGTSSLKESLVGCSSTTCCPPWAS
jgi:hypothetical protein